ARESCKPRSTAHVRSGSPSFRCHFLSRQFLSPYSSWRGFLGACCTGFSLWFFFRSLFWALFFLRSPPCSSVGFLSHHWEKADSEGLRASSTGECTTRWNECFSGCWTPTKSLCTGL